MVPGSPFKAGGTARTLPITVRTGEGKLVIRLDDTTLTDKVIFRVGGEVDATHAGGYLKGGEAVSIELTSLAGNEIPISLLNTSGDPDIYWSIL